MITKEDAQSRFQRYVAVRIVGTEEEVRGQVIQVGNDAFVLQTKTDTRVVPFADIESLIERRRGVIVRRLRKIPRNISARQHLADRHAVFKSLLSVADEDLCHEMHSNINHHDLAHVHVDPEESMAVLDELHEAEGN